MESEVVTIHLSVPNVIAIHPIGVETLNAGEVMFTFICVKIFNLIRRGNK